MGNTNENGLIQQDQYGQSLLGRERDNPTTKRVGFLFGYPIAHALGPRLHNLLWTRYNIPWTCQYVNSADIKDFLPALHAPNCVGASVTMPHKVACMAHVDAFTEEARLIGAINTVFVRLNDNTSERRYIGTNTDCIGMRDAFETSFPGIRNVVRGMAGMVIGGGGTARAAVYALWKFFGINVVYIVNRIASEVEQVVASMTAGGCPVQLIHVKAIEDVQGRETPRIIVGAIPDIAPRTVDELQVVTVVTAFLKKLQCIPGPDKEGFLLDMCYHPRPVTRLIKSAKECGWQTVTGVEALIFGCMAQSMLWSEKSTENYIIDGDEIQFVRAGLMEHLKRSSAA